eukprot:scaffold239864_cov32-Tisochrysis_lutea.AAC.2
MMCSIVFPLCEKAWGGCGCILQHQAWSPLYGRSSHLWRSLHVQCYRPALAPKGVVLDRHVGNPTGGLGADCNPHPGAENVSPDGHIGRRKLRVCRSC